jgi:threonine synthase
VAEQLNWTLPDHVVIPLGSGALLCAVHRGFEQLIKVGLVERKKVKHSGAQPLNCSPIASAVREKRDIVPVKNYKTIAHSLAIGNPADGHYAKAAILDSGGYASTPSEEEIIEGIKLLAKTEGIFTEPAGGTTIAGLKLLTEEGIIESDECIVAYVTGNGLKAQETIARFIQKPVVIKPKVEAFETITGSIFEKESIQIGGD